VAARSSVSAAGPQRHFNGGCQLDHTQATIDALPEIVEAVDGAAGVDRTLQILRDEISTSLGLCGQTSIRGLTPDLIRRVDY